MEKTFFCNVCNCGFTKKYYLQKHFTSQKHKRRETSSEATISTYNCDCGKKYLHRQSFQVHKQKCTHDAKCINTRRTDYENEIEQIHIQYEKEKTEMRNQIEKLIEKVGNTTTNNIENQNNNITININAFGNENLDYITDQYVIQCVNQIYGSIPTIIEKIHFDPEHPENHNIKITNKKLPHATIMCSDNKWKMIDREHAISTLVDNGFCIIDEKFKQDPSQFTEERRRHYRRFQENYDNEDKETLKRVKNDVELVVLNGTKEM